MFGGWENFFLILKFIFFFGLTIFLAQWGSKFIARRLGPMATGTGKGKLALLDVLPLGPQRGVYLVRAGRRFYLVGVSREGMVSLGELAPEDLGEMTSAVGPLAEGEDGSGESQGGRKEPWEDLLARGGWLEEVRRRLGSLKDLAGVAMPRGSNSNGSRGSVASQDPGPGQGEEGR